MGRIIPYIMEKKMFETTHQQKNIRVTQGHQDFDTAESWVKLRPHPELSCQKHSAITSTITLILDANKGSRKVQGPWPNSCTVLPQKLCSPDIKYAL